MFRVKSLIDFTNLFSLNNFEKNYKVIFNYFLKHDEVDNK